MNENGFAVCNGTRMRVDSVVLDDGRIILRMHCDGPCVLEGPVTVYGRDGRGVLQDTWVPRRAVAAGETALLDYRIRVDRIEPAEFRWRDRARA